MQSIFGNARGLVEIEFGSSKTWSEVATITAPVQTVTIPGLKTTDKIVGIQKPTNQNGLVVSGGFVSAADELSVKFSNPTAGGITPTANETYTVFVWRSEKPRTDACF